MALTHFDIGDAVEAFATFDLEMSGERIDPPVVECKILDPLGTSTTYIFGVDAELENPNAGDYALLVKPTTSGVWASRWEAIDNVTTDSRSGAVEVQFYVRRSVFALAAGGGSGGRGSGDIDGGTP